MGKMRNVETILVVKPEEDLGIGGRTILKRILKKYSGRVWTGFIWLRIGTGGGLL
jgi:hypothetical protein